MASVTVNNTLFNSSTTFNIGTTFMDCFFLSINVIATGASSFVLGGDATFDTSANSFNTSGTNIVTVASSNGFTATANTSTVNYTYKLDKEISNIVKRSSFDKTYIQHKKDITYSDFLSNKMLMIFVIREGVPYSLFNLIQHFTPFTEDNWADFLNISTKSLHRYKQNLKSFKSIQSEKIIEISEVTKVGLDVFGEMDKFKLWLETPNFSLGNLKPLELLKDSYGIELVVSELTRINYGILV